MLGKVILRKRKSAIALRGSLFPRKLPAAILTFLCSILIAGATVHNARAQNLKPQTTPITNLVQPGWYGAIDLGFRQSNGGFRGTSTDALGGMPALWDLSQQSINFAGYVRAGFQFSAHWRAEAEFGYHPSNIGNCTVSGGDCDVRDGKIDSMTLMGNVIYDFTPGATVAPFMGPFIGAGIGIHHIKMDVNGVFSNVAGGSGNLDINGSDTAFAWQALAGVAVRATDRLKVDLTYRYSAFGNISTHLVTPTTDGSIRSHDAGSSVTVGLRYALSPQTSVK
jgi:OmpA-OmpF porin, OOP family